MKQTLAHLELGNNILIILDECPPCLDMLDTIVTNLPDISTKHITLLYCCLMFRHDLDGDLISDEQESLIEQQYLYQATDILHGAGVPQTHISIARAIGKKCLVAAIMAELKRKSYTGLIIREYYRPMVRSLQQSGLMDEFGHIQNVVIWALPTDTMVPAMTGL